MNNHSIAEPIDERWVAHLRDLSAGVVPPTPANPHAMSRVAIRRTRTRRAVLVTGGGVTAVAAVAGAAFALGGPTTTGVLLPGGATSASDALTKSASESATADVPDGWEVHELEGLTYALPPEMVTSGPVQDDLQHGGFSSLDVLTPGVTSDMWHSSDDPDAPPFLRIAYVTPDYEFYDTKARGLTQTPGPDAWSFDLPGASVATIEGDGALPEIAGARESEALVRKILVHRADGPGRYLITMTLPAGSEDFVGKFQASLSLD
jgi:hypothetical protein